MNITDSELKDNGAEIRLDKTSVEIFGGENLPGIPQNHQQRINLITYRLEYRCIFQPVRDYPLLMHAAERQAGLSLANKFSN